MNRVTESAASSAQTAGGGTGGGGQAGALVQRTPILDRSRAQLRLPADMVSESLSIAHVQSIPDVDTSSSPEPPSPETIERLEAAGMLAEGSLDPIAFELLDVVNQASLVIAVDLQYQDDSSVPTVWCTPRRAVVSSSLDPGHTEFRPVPVTQLPQVLAELIVLRSPRFIGDVPISISTELLELAVAAEDRESALEILTEGGLDADQAVLMLDLQRPDVRRWQISSTWSTDEGQQGAELRGLDAGPSGQWLIGTTTPDDGGPAQQTFTPQGHGEIMSAFRSVLPKNWMGTPLNRPAETR